MTLCLHITVRQKRHKYTGVNPAGDTSLQYFGWGDVNGNIPPILLRTFGYSRPILVALRPLSLKPISFGYKTPPIRFSQADGQSAHKARPPTLNSRWRHCTNMVYIQTDSPEGSNRWIWCLWLCCFVFLRLVLTTGTSMLVEINVVVKIAIIVNVVSWLPCLTQSIQTAEVLEAW